MSREAHIPLVLWISTAILAHIAGGRGADEVAQTIHDRAEIRGLVNAVREGLRPQDITFEVLVDEPSPSPQKAEPPKDDQDKPKDDDKDKQDDAKPDPNEIKPPKPPKITRPLPVEPPKPKAEDKPPPPPQPPPPPPPPPPPQDMAKNDPPPPPPPPPMVPDKRIAIRQHVDPDQKDNPTAQRLAEQANNVKEETVARLRSHDQDDKNPNAGEMKKPAATGDGNNDHEKVADSEQRAGTKNAPGESKDHSESAEHHHVVKNAPSLPQVAQATPPPMTPGGGAKGGNAGGGAKAPAAPAGPPPVAGGAGPTSPEVVAAEGSRGGFTMDPANTGGDGKSKRAGKRRSPAPYESPVKVGSVGLGSPGTPGGPNLNLSMAGFEASVGQEKLKAERMADGEARKSAHRGKWDKNNFGRYKSAIENYEPTVKVGNQTALNAAQSVFATYLNTIHNRLHPIFAEEFLASLDRLPQGHLFNSTLVTHLEIVISKEEGKIVKMGVTKPSGMTAFDIVALNSMNRSSPFGRAPDAIVSYDGRVYLHWEFHRDPFDACSTRNAYPYLLPSPKDGGATPGIPPKPPRSGNFGPSDERRTPGPLLPLPTP